MFYEKARITNMVIPQYIIYGAWAILLICVYVGLRRSRQYTVKSHTKKDIRAYSLGGPILTSSELTLFRVIKKHLGRDYMIAPKVRLADFIYVKSGKPNKAPQSTQPLFNRISSKHSDFLICTPKGRPLAWIELDDKSHNSFHAKRADKFKDDLARGINLPLHRIKIGEDYNDRLRLIKSTL